MSNDDGSRPGGSALEDPLEEDTQPVEVARPREEPAEGQGGETTTTLGHHGPPVVTGPSEPQDKPQEKIPEPLAETVVQTEPEGASSSGHAAESASDSGDYGEGVQEEDGESTLRLTGELPEQPVEVAQEASDVISLDGPFQGDPAPRPEVESRARQGLAPSSSLRPLLLERIQPTLGQGERLRLDATHWKLTLGRGEQNDIRLYTGSASREHAIIAGNALGKWIVTPAEGKFVLIDGAKEYEPVELEVGMNLVMGGDQLRCVTEGIERVEMSAQTLAEGFGASAPAWLARLRDLTTQQRVMLGSAIIALVLLVAVLL